MNVLGVRAFVLVFVPERRLTRSRSRLSEGVGGEARRSRRREWTNRVGRASKYEREIDGERNGNSNSSRGSNCYDIYNCLCFLALKVLNTTQALGALALGEGGGTLNIWTIDLLRDGKNRIGSEQTGYASKVGKVEKWKGGKVERWNSGKGERILETIHTLLQEGERQLGG